MNISSFETLQILKREDMLILNYNFMKFLWTREKKRQNLAFSKRFRFLTGITHTPQNTKQMTLRFALFACLHIP